ncbi:YycH family regulatory protein [Companilactobacillus kimchiensis]|uniref:YycH family regulatory protein n=1 Tax=Companilactobacillus kimchiensis TaxID=993692 RepID=UPI0007088FD7|nr:two-component system activity regulator YycH [Companilactobacillus kimchiensis]
MKFSRLIVQLLLVVAVITSIVLSFFIWTNTARYQRGRNIDVTSAESNKNEIPMNQVISPTQVMWHDETDQHLIYNSNTNISLSIQKVMQDWKIDEPKLVSKKDGAYYQKVIQSKNMIQMVYPTAITTNTLGSLLNNNSLKNDKGSQFNRILINLKNKKDQNIYLADDSNYSVYKAKVRNASAVPIAKLVKKANINLKVRLNIMKHGVFTFYVDPIKMKSYSYVISGKKDGEYTTALFDSNTSGLVTSEDNNIYTYNYGESKRLVSDHNTEELTFEDYTDTSVPKTQLAFMQRGYQKVVNLQNSVSNLRLYNADWKNKDLIFREYVEGFPIFKKSQFGSIRIKFSRKGSSEHFLNKVLEVPVPSNQAPTKLKSTNEIFKGLQRAGYSPNDVQAVEVGYQWESETENEKVVDLKPTYYIKIGNHWKPYDEWSNESAEED